MKKIIIAVSIVIGLVLVLGLVYYVNVKADAPELTGKDTVTIQVNEVAEDSFVASNGSWLRKNDKNTWEMFLQGEPYELGRAFGELTQALSAEKEAAFIGEIENRIPSPSYLNFLKYLVGWFNRDLDEYVPEEYLREIYGSSAYMPDSFDYITTKYQRALSYHAAHDIGHMLQNMNMVGCTSFATWGDKSENGRLLIGRNFDFYFGQDFARDKIIAFYNPQKGYQFMSVTWAGFSGVVSGMNEKGLSVTLNSAKSEIPSKGKTPVSLIARQILQYASTIDEAYSIASGYESFIAETFLIGSKTDGKVGLIEKTPEETALFIQDNNELIATNHFQSEVLAKDPLNQEYMDEGVSGYRYQRVEQMIDSLTPLNPEKVAYILRDKNGLNGQDIGLGNEKAINQLIAHHSVIFSPEDMTVWISTPPYQLGDYLAYHLDSIFAKKHTTFSYSKDLSLPPDSFLLNGEYARYQMFEQVREQIQHFQYTGTDPKLTQTEQQAFVQSNPKSFLTYYYLGDYLLAHKEWQKAMEMYQTGLSMEIAKVSERKHMEEGLQTCIEELRK